MSRKVSEFMIEHPISIKENISLAKVMQKFDDAKISHLLVKDTNGNLTGIISKNDILDKLRKIVNMSSGLYYSDKLISSTKAKDVMSSNLIKLNKDDNINQAIEMLLQKEFHCLPVVENEIPVGVITLYDLLKGYYQEYG